MRVDKSGFFALAGVGACALTLSVGAQDHQHKMTEPTATQADARQLVKFPEPMRLHTITSMRDHVRALREIGFPARAASSASP